MKNIEIKDPNPQLLKLFSYKEWRQRVRLYDDIFSPGTRGEYEWDLCNLPSSLKGKSFIDVGANDGMFSFLAEEKGAGSVKSVDLYVDENETNMNMMGGWPISRIKEIKKIKNSSIDVESCSIYDLQKLGQKYDVVFCGNVIAWLQNPLGALDQLCAITKEKLIIREDISPVKGKPVLEYVNNKDFTACSFNGNEEFYRSYLQARGFKKVEIVPVDEYKIFERRSADFKKYEIAKGVKVFSNPFSENDFVYSEKLQATGAALINGKYFLDKTGWVNQEDAKLLPDMVPVNPIKRKIFESRMRRNALNNCMIFAEK
ncbi:MAG: methyltransferase domain-containing protein [Bacteroidota bacterium]